MRFELQVAAQSPNLRHLPPFPTDDEEINQLIEYVIWDIRALGGPTVVFFSGREAERWVTDLLNARVAADPVLANIFQAVLATPQRHQLYKSALLRRILRLMGTPGA